MSRVLDRIQKLLALAGSSNENEARTAAFLAAKLIRENGIVLSEPGTSRPFSFEDIFAGVAPSAPVPNVPRPRRQKDFLGRVWFRHASNWRDEHCSYCGKEIPRGEPIVLRKPGREEAFYHEPCWENSLRNRPKPETPPPRPPPPPDLTDDEIRD